MSGSDLCIPRNENYAALLFPKQNYNVLSPIFHIHDSVNGLYIPRISPHLLLQPNRQTDPVNIKIAHRYMSVGLVTRPCSFISGNT